MAANGSYRPTLPGSSAHNRRMGMAIRGPETGHSLSAIFPVSPSPIGHFGKEQSGTDFGQAKPLGVRQRDRGGRFPPDVRLRDSVVSYTSLQTRLVPQKPRHTIRPKLSIFATRHCRLRGKRGRQAADYAACATRSAVCADQFQGMSSSHRAAGQSAAIFPVTSAM